MLDPEFLALKFEAGSAYDRYVAAGRPDQRHAWARSHDSVALSDAQRALLAGFVRRMNVLVTSGLWCGDCSAQVPMLDRIAHAAPPGVIDLRILDRDLHSDLGEQVRICGGLRVPTVLFLNEDLEFVSMLGDRTLTRLRARAARSLGASCPLPGSGVEQDEARGTLQDWVNEFERVQLLLRLSPKLIDRHGP